MLALDLADEPLPKRKRFRVWVVDPQDGNPLVDPEHNDGQQLVPELAPGFRLEVERDDVLVLLRWVLGVLDGAVSAVLEPLGGLSRVWVVGRALECDVDGHLDSVLTGGSEQVVEVVDRAELGVCLLYTSDAADDLLC